ncbi:hypothetical protein LEN26_021209 [Aphanomyces euteiches]|nr:hypothetical protein LEN26_021209 [Aphanomyces euteiches]
MVEVSLNCLVVGEETPFPVDIDAKKSVGHLKDMISVKKIYQFPADELQLYHTLKGDTEVDEDILRKLKQQGSSGMAVKYVNDIAWMNPIKLLKRYFDANPPVEEQIHIFVVVPEGAARVHYAVPSYFILPETRGKVAKAVFMIVEENEGGGCGRVGIGVFFSPTLAVTCDHNLTEEHTVGCPLTLAMKNDEREVVEVVARNSELNFAILKASGPRSFIAPWNGSPEALESRYDLVLASFRLGIVEYQALGFAPAACIAISHHKRHIMYACPAYAGDSGAALILKDGFLVGIHLETINALREEIERKKVIKDRLNDVEQSQDMIVRSGLAQGCLGILVHEFKSVVRG